MYNLDEAKVKPLMQATTVDAFNSAFKTLVDQDTT
jgi:hypothetical protein